MPDDPLEYKAEADAALDRLAQRLRRLLQEATGRLDPFPPFPGAFFTHGIEIEATGVDSPERGCVVLAPDGELYELEMGQDLTALALVHPAPVPSRAATRPKPEASLPRARPVYAYSALTQVVELLLERQAEAQR